MVQVPHPMEHHNQINIMHPLQGSMEPLDMVNLMELLQ